MSLSMPQRCGLHLISVPPRCEKFALSEARQHLLTSGASSQKNSSDHNTQISFLSEHMHRIQKLTFSILLPADTPLPPLNLTTAPLLRSISLFSVHARSSPVESFGGYLPCLKEVDLTNVILTWSPPPFPSLCLTHLHLSHVPRPSPDILLATLKSLSSTLVSLRLDSCLPTTQLSASHDQTNLPKLKTLYLSDTESACLLLLRYVTFPQTTSLTIMLHRSDFVELRHRLEAFANHFAVQVKLIRSLFLSHRGPRITLKASPHHLGDMTPYEWQRYPHSTSLSFSYRNREDEEPPARHIIRHFCGHLSLAAVTSCLMDDRCVDEHHHWSPMLASLPSLQYLSIGGALLPILINQLLGADPTGSPNLPFLMAVSITSLPVDASDDFKQLLELLEDREDLGLPLKTLYIEDEAKTLPHFYGDDGGGDESLHFVSRLSYNFRITEVIGRDRLMRIWFHWIQRSVEGGDGLTSSKAYGRDT